ncbi:MAG: hypothetical protein F4089_10710 [Gammaproteobacteria bacterium]|nr:hypothetical protein [Gammaproteobacteria bacterium]
MRCERLRRWPLGDLAKSVRLRPRRLSALCVAVLVVPILNAGGQARAGEAEAASPGGREGAVVVEGAGTVEGELLWGEGHRYQGGLKEGRMHGRGTHTAPDGEVYAGDFVDGRRHGRGVLRFPNGDVYEGDFRNSAMTGNGRLTWSNGDVYEGDFVNGVREGKGVLTRQLGGTYVGGFSGDQRHGLGHYRWRDGTLYKGYFRSGSLDGSGVKRSPDGTLSFETWNDGQLTAAVTVEAVERCILTIEGKAWMFKDDTCINGLAHGEGLAVALDGTAYIPNGRFILGNIVRGEVRSVELDEFP